jgi:hypothetical protein
MKASTKPELTKKWWTSEKPADIKGVDLEKALANVEKALAEEKKKKGDAESLEAAVAACGELEAAVDKTIKKECDKKKHKDVIEVLQKYFPLIKEENSRLKELLDQAAGEGEDGEDEEETDDKIFQPDYLYKMLKLLKSTGKELNFGFGLDTKNPEASKLVLTRKGKPERLFKALKQTGDFSNRLITYGKAAPDAQDGKVLVFKLAESAGEPPQVLKLGRRFLRSDKALKFRKLKLIMPGGQTFNDTEPDPEDMVDAAAAGRAGGAADLSKELAAVQGLEAAWKQTLSNVTAQIDRLRKAMDGQNQPVLRSVSEGLAKLMDQFPDLDLSKLSAAAKANDRAAYDRTRLQTAGEVGDVYEMLAEGPLLSTIDENPFVKTTVHPTVKSMLERVTSELNLKA